MRIYFYYKLCLIAAGVVLIIVLCTRLSGFENSLFGWKSRLYPTVKKLIKEKQDDIEVIQFGKIALHKTFMYTYV